MVSLGKGLNQWLTAVGTESVTFFRRHPVGAIGGIVLILVIFRAVFASFLVPYHPTDDADFLNRNAEPSSSHVLGTDSIGRDVVSRVIHGARI